MGTEQRCGRCKQVLPVGSFSPSYRGRNGTWCRPCTADYARGNRGRSGVPHKPRTCVHCGKEYVPKALKAAAAYCSRACKDNERLASGKNRDEHLRRKYGISSEDYDRLLAEQGGGCALCGVRPEELTTGRFRNFLHVDHCHDTGRVRGLLCPEHNLLLGKFGDSPDMFRKVLAYLEGTPT